MEKYIKYKRISQEVTIKSIETLFDELISGGWEIIYYFEDRDNVISLDNIKFWVTLVVGKKQSNIL